MDVLYSQSRVGNIRVDLGPIHTFNRMPFVYNVVSIYIMPLTSV